MMGEGKGTYSDPDLFTTHEKLFPIECPTWIPRQPCGILVFTLSKVDLRDLRKKVGSSNRRTKPGIFLHVQSLRNVVPNPRYINKGAWCGRIFEHIRRGADREMLFWTGNLQFRRERWNAFGSLLLIFLSSFSVAGLSVAVLRFVLL